MKDKVSLQLIQIMQHHAEILLEDTVDETQALNIIQEQIKENPLLIYMKGNASLPQCGFSAQVVEIFNNLGAKYKTFNILNHYPIRENIKNFLIGPLFPKSITKENSSGAVILLLKCIKTENLPNYWK